MVAVTVYPPEAREDALELRHRGWGYRRIGRHLGVSDTAVRRWVNPEYAALDRRSSREAKMRRRGVCADCGAPTSLAKNSRPSKRCAACSIVWQKANTVWTREAIVEAIRYYAVVYGRPPGAMEWNPPQARSVGRVDLSDRFYADNCWPLSGSAQKAFGSWNSAIAAAGFTPLKPGHKYSDVRS